MEVRTANSESGNCRHCGKALGLGAVGTGNLEDGLFCDLDCLVAEYPDYFRRRAAAAKDQAN